MSPSSFEFLDWLDQWYADLPDVSLRKDILQKAGGADRTAVLVVDLLVGFCGEGPLASPRVGALAAPAARFLRAAWASGIERMVHAADSHPQDSPEFSSFPPHCITGSPEAEPIPELKSLPLFSSLRHVRKRSLNLGHEPEFGAWQMSNAEVRSWIVVGDCTDLCVYQAAMHLRLQANTRGLHDFAVWVPAGLVATYDLPVEAAAGTAALPHDGDLMHRIFLYHMALNGIRVVRDIRP